MKQAAILGGLILAIFLAAKYKMARSYEVLINKIKFTGSLANPEILLTIGINNPTPYWANITKLSGKIYINDSLAATIDKSLDLKIEKEKITELEIPIQILPIGAVISLLTGLTGKYFKIKIEGFIIIDNLPIPINYTYGN